MIFEGWFMLARFWLDVTVCFRGFAGASGMWSLVRLHAKRAVVEVSWEYLGGICTLVTCSGIALS